MDELCQTSGKFVSLDASGLAVGLPEGLMGNSEVGHLTIGAGRALYQVCNFCSRYFSDSVKSNNFSIYFTFCAISF